MNWLASTYRLCRLAVAVVLFASGSRAFATDYSWNVVSGDFLSNSNWNPTGVPGDGLDDRAFIDNGGTATLSAFHNPQLLNVDIGSTAGSSGTLVLNAGSDLLSDKIRIGLEGTGTATVNNGIMRALGGKPVHRRPGRLVG